MMLVSTPLNALCEREPWSNLVCQLSPPWATRTQIGISAASASRDVLRATTCTPIPGPSPASGELPPSPETVVSNDTATLPRTKL
jgi:hypothetical protein